MFDRFTKRAIQVMSGARRAALDFSHDHIGTEHILAGLVREGRGAGAGILTNHDIDAETVLREIGKDIERGPNLPTKGPLPFTDAGKHVLKLSLEEASHLQHRHIGTEHLLLGLLGEGQGTAALVLRRLGCDLDGIRREVVARSEEKDPVAPDTGRRNSNDATRRSRDPYAGEVEIFFGCLAALPVPDRTMLWMRFCEDRGWNEIAEQIGMRGADAARMRAAKVMEQLNDTVRSSLS